MPLDTASGVRLDLDDPRPDDITLSDVAAALSKTCRFGAQARSFYSVAQHAVLVANLVEDAGHPELALAALHHDSHEAYACDLPTPLKRRIDDASEGYYSRLCDALDAAIDEAFGISGLRDDPLAAEVIKAADEQALLIESQDLLHDGGRGLRAGHPREPRGLVARHAGAARPLAGRAAVRLGARAARRTSRRCRLTHAMGEIERGWHAPTVTTAKRIADALKLPLSELVRDM